MYVQQSRHMDEDCDGRRDRSAEARMDESVSISETQSVIDSYVRHYAAPVPAIGVHAQPSTVERRRLFFPPLIPVSRFARAS